MDSNTNTRQMAGPSTPVVNNASTPVVESFSNFPQLPRELECMVWTSATNGVRPGAHFFTVERLRDRRINPEIQLDLKLNPDPSKSDSDAFKQSRSLVAVPSAHPDSAWRLFACQSRFTVYKVCTCDGREPHSHVSQEMTNEQLEACRTWPIEVEWYRAVEDSPWRFAQSTVNQPSSSHAGYRSLQNACKNSRAQIDFMRAVELRQLAKENDPTKSPALVDLVHSSLEETSGGVVSPDKGRISVVASTEKDLVCLQVSPGMRDYESAVVSAYRFFGEMSAFSAFRPFAAVYPAFRHVRKIAFEIPECWNDYMAVAVDGPIPDVTSTCPYLLLASDGWYSQLPMHFPSLETVYFIDYSAQLSSPGELDPAAEVFDGPSGSNWKLVEIVEGNEKAWTYDQPEVSHESWVEKMTMVRDYNPPAEVQVQGKNYDPFRHNFAEFYDNSKTAFDAGNSGPVTGMDVWDDSSDASDFYEDDDSEDDAEDGSDSDGSDSDGVGLDGWESEEEHTVVKGSKYKKPERGTLEDFLWREGNKAHNDDFQTNRYGLPPKDFVDVPYAEFAIAKARASKTQPVVKFLARVDASVLPAGM